MNRLKTLLFTLCLAPSVTFAASSGMPLDEAPIDTRDKASLQRGAESFVSYCLTCHGASYMRYNRHRDLDLSEKEIMDKLIFTGQKAGGLMLTSMKKKEGEEWFGVAPPDLTVIARSRGADWLYTYLRAFYRDDTTVSGWNNLVFDKVAMPHVLYHLQGEQSVTIETKDAGEYRPQEIKKLRLDVPGKLTKTEYDQFVADLVNYIVYIGEPIANDRKDLGVIVMIFLFCMLGLTYALKKEYWKDIH